ncbi:MAG: hypothetical protein NT062_11480 [Proteobacteria bacterium]|nr:hypothetical protein [Pseudomonadota bacterium]
MAAITDFLVVTELTWTSPPLAVFEAMAATMEARFGPPSERDLDSNGVGLFDALCVRFSCGLEVGLSRFHLGAQLRTVDPATDPSRFEIHANQRDLAHIGFHLGVPIEMMSLWTDRDGVPQVMAPPNAVIVMRTGDDGNDAEVTRLTNRCQAAALVSEFEARGHKQAYWIEDTSTSPPASRWNTTVR